jgi:vitamin B12 transporter
VKKLGILYLLSFGLSVAEEVNIVSSYGTKTSVEETTSPVDVITEDKIEETKPKTITEIITKISDISFTSNGGYGQTTSIYLRGFEPKRTLVLIDGIRINDPTGLNGAMLEHILATDISQIEIIKGTQSGVWGADATAGVINIISKTPQKGFHSNAYFEYGSYVSRRYGTTFSLANEKMYILFGLHRFDSQSISAAEPYGKRWKDLNMEPDPYKNDTVNLKVGLNITANDKIESSMRFIDARVNYDGFDPITFKPADANNKAHINEKFYTFKYEKDLTRDSFNLYYNQSDFYRYYDEPSGWIKRYGYEGKTKELGFKYRFNYMKNAFLNLGFVRQDFIEHDTNVNNRYHNSGYFLTNLFKVKDLILSQSIRRDNYSKFDDKTTFKLGGKYLINKDFYIFANYGTAYNVPTLYQLFSLYGNPNLKPENTKSYDLGLSYKGFSFDYFDYKIKDMIDFDLNTFKYANISGESKIKGYEMRYKNSIKILNTDFYIGYTNLSAKDSNDKDLPRRPKEKLDINITVFPTENFTLDLNGQYIGKRKDTNQTQTGYYTVINSSVNFKINKYLTAYLKIDNITDKYYQTVYGYASFGRSIYAGLNGKF